jgi:hypothetical protein
MSERPDRRVPYNGPPYLVWSCKKAGISYIAPEPDCPCCVLVAGEGDPSHVANDDLTSFVGRARYDALLAENQRLREVTDDMVARGVGAVQEEFDDGGLGPADLIVREILNAALTEDKA